MFDPGETLESFRARIICPLSCAEVMFEVKLRRHVLAGSRWRMLILAVGFELSRDCTV